MRTQPFREGRSQALKCPPQAGCPPVSGHYCHLQPPAAGRVLEKRWQREVRGRLSLETPINLLWPRKWGTATQPLKDLQDTWSRFLGSFSEQASRRKGQPSGDGKTGCSWPAKEEGPPVQRPEGQEKGVWPTQRMWGQLERRGGGWRQSYGWGLHQAREVPHRHGPGPGGQRCWVRRRLQPSLQSSAFTTSLPRSHFGALKKVGDLTQHSFRTPS